MKETHHICPLSSQAAFEMLDNYQRIKKETARSNDLMIQAKIGQHEEVRRSGRRRSRRLYRRE